MGFKGGTLEKKSSFADKLFMKFPMIFAFLCVSTSFTVLATPMKQIFDEQPRVFDLDLIEKEEQVTTNDRVEPQLKDIKKEVAKDVTRDEVKRIPASTTIEKQSEHLEDKLLSLVQESLFEKEIAKRNLDSVIKDKELSLDDEDTEEDFGDVEVRWKAH